MEKRHKRLVAIVVVILIIALLVVLNRTFGSEIFNLSKLKGIVDGLGAFGPPIIIAVLIVQGVFSIFPASVIFILAGVSFGTVWGSIYSLTGALLGAAVAFAFAKKFGKKIEYALISKRKADNLIKITKKKGAYITSVGRMLPIFPPDVVSFAAGISEMKFKKYIFTSAIGFLIPIIIIVFIGESLLRGPTGAIVSLAVVAALVIIYAIQRNHHKIALFMARRMNLK